VWDLLEDERSRLAVEAVERLADGSLPDEERRSYRRGAQVARSVEKLADSIYEERAFERMAILGDALEEAGCGNQEMLTHCRQQGLAHVRGCWALDLLMQKG
jgi:hypothetical protein